MRCFQTLSLLNLWLRWLFAPFNTGVMFCCKLCLNNTSSFWPLSHAMYSQHSMYFQISNAQITPLKVKVYNGSDLVWSFCLSFLERIRLRIFATCFVPYTEALHKLWNGTQMLRMCRLWLCSCPSDDNHPIVFFLMHFWSIKMMTSAAQWLTLCALNKTPGWNCFEIMNGIFRFLIFRTRRRRS